MRDVIPSAAMPVVVANMDSETEYSGVRFGPPLAPRRKKIAVGMASTSVRMPIAVNIWPTAWQTRASPAKRFDVQWMVRPKPCG